MRKFRISFPFFVFLFGTTLCWANPIVTIGQTTVLTEFNYHFAEFSQDPNNPLPLPVPREVYAADNIARGSLAAQPGQAGEANAVTGVVFDWDLQGHTWQEVHNLPVAIIFDFDYEISADWTEGTGSANAGVMLPGFSDAWYDFIGHARGVSGMRGGHVVETFTARPWGTPLTVGELGHSLDVYAYDQAHSGPNSGATNASSAWVRINSITVESASIPEPATLALLTLGLAGLGFSRRKQ